MTAANDKSEIGGEVTGRSGSRVGRLAMFGVFASAILVLWASASWSREWPPFWRCRANLPTLRCVHSGHESSAIGSLRNLATAQSIYRKSDKEVRGGASQYADTLAELSASGTDLIDDILGTGMHQAYDFRISAQPDGFSWDGEAHPANANCGGKRFYVNTAGEIWFSTNDVATPVPLSGGTKGPPPGFRRLGG